MSVDWSSASLGSPGVSPAPPCRVAILGCGEVGGAVARRLARGAVSGLVLTHILDRRAGEKRALRRSQGDPVADAGIAWTTRFDDVLASDADVVVELVGGLEPAADWIRAALVAGKSVVTANKQVVARDGPALWTLASRQGRQLRFEAAVGGAMPIVGAVKDGLAGDRITRIAAILNGTSNAVLWQIEATGCTVAHAVAGARARGWAEADPSSDLDGLDARAKLAVLCALAFRLRIDPARIETRSISSIRTADFVRVRRRGCTIRQIAYAEYDVRRSALVAWVAPAIVARDSIFGRTVGPDNAALLTGTYAGQVGLYGAGAGGEATAVAVIADLLAIARDRAALVPAPALVAPAVVEGLDPSASIVEFDEDRREGPSLDWIVGADDHGCAGSLEAV